YSADKSGLKAGSVVLDELGLSGVGFFLGPSGVEAVQGTIGGWTLEASRIYSGRVQLLSSGRIEVTNAQGQVQVSLGDHSGGVFGLKAGPVTLVGTGLTGPGFSLTTSGIEAT